VRAGRSFSAASRAGGSLDFVGRRLSDSVIPLTPPIAKVLKGSGGAGVLELIEDDARGTYRAAYTVSYSSAVYVLHVFQKKSKRGKQTSQRDIDLIRERLKRASEIHRMKVTENKQ
jgi:phage-related protein